MSVSDDEISVRWLGRVDFDEGLRVQDEMVAGIRDRTLGSQLLLLEHEPVYTIGRTRDQSSLRDVSQLPHPVREINRGGQATYHGPGQLVGYPLLDLHRYGRDLHRYLRFLEQVLIDALAEFGIAGRRSEGQTGVWVGERKIASIGVGVRHWISMHGFALNVSTGIDGFDNITPCGIAGVRMTSIESESGNPVKVKTVADIIGVRFTRDLSTLSRPT